MDNNVIKKVREELKRGNYTTFEKIYKHHQHDFEEFCRIKGLLEDDIMEVYNDVMLAFHDNVVNGKLTDLTATLKTYLWGIGKNMIHKRHQSLARHKVIEWQGHHDQEHTDHEQDQSQKHNIRLALDHLGGSCRELLILFYYRKYSISAIMHTMEYKNENTVKAHKSRCMKKLQVILKEKFKVA